MKRPRVLLSAYQCAPGQGSVSQIGWEWYVRLSQFAQVTLITHIRNRSSLQEALPSAAAASIIYVNTEAFAGPLYRIATLLFPRSQHSVFLISSFDYFVFDRLAYRLLKRYREKCGCHWDIIHCVTPVSPAASCTLHRLGVPLVLGPLNGGLPSPTTFPEFMKQDASWLYPLRNLGRLAEWLNHGMAKAALIFTATQATRLSIPVSLRAKCRQMLENGVDLTGFQAAPWPANPSASNPLRILFVGRLLPFKGVTMLLDAVKILGRDTPFRLTIVGDGPERVHLEAQTKALGLSGSIDFLGHQDLRVVSEAMRCAHVFCLPSVRESGGAVLLEAMASQRPVIAIKYGGPAELVTEEVGHAIAPAGRAHVVRELADTLRDIPLNPGRWRQKGVAGRQIAEREFSWEAKIQQALGFYNQLIERKSLPCDFDTDPAHTPLEEPLLLGSGGKVR